MRGGESGFDITKSHPVPSQLISSLASPNQNPNPNPRISNSYYRLCPHFHFKNNNEARQVWGNPEL